MANVADDHPHTASRTAGRARSGGRADKHAAIMGAALIVFGRDGYSRTSIDAIAAEAGVSTRTIYNHFDGKEQLFSAVLHASATQVADGFIDNVGRRPAGADLRSDLIALGRSFAAQRTDFPEHFAMVGQIRAESPHFPAAIIAAWHEAGPLRVQREVASRLAELADRGLLHIGDRSRAAVHFGALVTAGLTNPPGGPVPSADEIDDVVAAGVDAFLNGYGAGPRGL